jgi:D-alanine transaminase
MPDIAYVNGRFGPLAEAVVHVEDRGFQFGDGVYEVVRTYQGRPFSLDAHLARLARSARALRLPWDRSASDWAALIDEGLRLSAFAETKIYIQLTRGQAPRDHPFPAGISPTTVLTFRELRPPEQSTRDNGVSAITLEDLRWGRCDIKSLNLLGNVLARQQAKEAGAYEAILVRDGLVTEGSVSNVMIVRDGVLFTAPEGPRILSGVTRTLVLDVARKSGVSVEEACVTQQQLYDASEVLLTGTTVEILSVVTVDGRPIGGGMPGPVSKRLMRGWERLLG